MINVLLMVIFGIFYGVLLSLIDKKYHALSALFFILPYIILAEFFLNDLFSYYKKLTIGSMIISFITWEIKDRITSKKLE